MESPWKRVFTSWANSTNIHIDALGLITILGTEEVSSSVGRLVNSRYTEFLPLLGGFVLAGNAFTRKKPSFSLYDVSGQMMTTELAGWFTRWLKEQDFHQIHHKIYWDTDSEAATEIFSSYFWKAYAVSIACHALLVALTLVVGDWWGFANVWSMIVSVIVRTVLSWQNRLGIDIAIDRVRAKKLEARAEKIIVIMDDSKVITMDAQKALIGPVFAQNPEIPNPTIYAIARCMGWGAFGAQVISIGMATLVIQICTVLVMGCSTILTVSKIGCDDWKMSRRITHYMRSVSETLEGGQGGIGGIPCNISSRLKAICSQYPLSYEDLQLGGNDQKDSRTRRRQDLYIWLDLNDKELDAMEAWGLVPRRHSIEKESLDDQTDDSGREPLEKFGPNESWWGEYWRKRKEFDGRINRQGVPLELEARSE
ncbi:hypothetical protein HDV57DRAFT_108174 [Trichoderma longibrachiatum]|uniref:Uncharacterized protein n=1 Tax=Trichoderma longibrachiatum ATCC 18648 TaxID=983965 RepID=A0A2T4C8Y3_TRILO|nr:hypothetical protein M440DRAFT_1399208 [Trichoderma longibrachiatum ATCC 18648]